MILIDIISDTVCPWCYIGKKRLEQAIKKSSDLNFNISWHAFQLNPNMPKQGMDRKVYLSKKFGGSHNVKNVYLQIEKAGSLTGIDFRFEKISRMPNSFNTHLLVEYAKEKKLQNKIVEDLFKSYFLGGKNIGDPTILTEIAINCGIENFAYEELINRKNLRENINKTDLNNKKIGISGVPFFIFNKNFAVSGAQESEVFERVFETCLLNDK